MQVVFSFIMNHYGTVNRSSVPIVTIVRLETCVRGNDVKQGGIRRAGVDVVVASFTWLLVVCISTQLRFRVGLPIQQCWDDQGSRTTTRSEWHSKMSHRVIESIPMSWWLVSSSLVQGDADECSIDWPTTDWFEEHHWCIVLLLIQYCSSVNDSKRENGNGENQWPNQSLSDPNDQM